MFYVVLYPYSRNRSEFPPAAAMGGLGGLWAQTGQNNSAEENDFAEAIIHTGLIGHETG